MSVFPGMPPRRLWGLLPADELLPTLVGVLLALWLTLALQGDGKEIQDQMLNLLPLALLGGVGLLLVRDPLPWIFTVFPYTLMLRVDPVYWALGGLVLLFLVLDMLQGDARHRLRAFDWVLPSLVLAAGLLGVRPSPDKAEALGMYAETYVLPLAFYLTIVRSPRGGEYARLLARHGVMAFAIIGLGSLMVKITQPWIPRPGGFFNQYPTMIGQTAAAVLPFCYARLARRWNPRELLLLGLVFMAMLLTNTRMAVLTTGLGLLLFPELWKRLALPALLFILARTWMVELGFFTRLKQVTSGLEESVVARFMGWQAALKLIAAHPWGGIGFSRFQHIYTKYIPFPVLRLQHAHNLLLNTCLELGIPGMLAVLGSSVAFLGRAAWKLRQGWATAQWNPERKAMIVACVVFLASGMVDSMFLSASWTMLFWSWMGGVRRLELDDEDAAARREESAIPAPGA